MGGGNNTPQNVINQQLNNLQNQSKLDTVALVISIIALLLCSGCFIFGILGLILSIIVLADNTGKFRSKTKGCIALALSILSLILMIVFISITISKSSDDKTNTKVDTETRIEVGTNNNNINTEDKNTESNEKQSETKEVQYEITQTQFYTFTNSIGSGQYFFAIEVKNTGNCSIYLDKCELDLEDGNGHLLQTDGTFSIDKSQYIIEPGEVGYFYNNSGYLNDNVTPSDVKECVPHIYIEKAKHDIKNFDISDVSISAQDWGFAKVTGRAENTSKEDDTLVKVTVVYYNSNNEILDIEFTYIDEIRAGEKKSFEIGSMLSSTKADYSDIESYKIIAQGTYFQW